MFFQMTELVEELRQKLADIERKIDAMQEILNSKT